MAAAEQPLPEGTDHIINGASATEDETPGSFGSGILDEDEAEITGLRDTDPLGAAGESPSGAEKFAGGTSASTASGSGALFEKFDEVKAQSFDRAREYAVLGKDRTTGALDDFIRMINDAASQVDAKVGSQYGDYARRAAEGIASFNDGLKGKDVDDLFTDARVLVAKAPAVTVGAAAALGFIVARLARAGIDTGNSPASKDAPPV